MRKSLITLIALGFWLIHWPGLQAQLVDYKTMISQRDWFLDYMIYPRKNIVSEEEWQAHFQHTCEERGADKADALLRNRTPNDGLTYTLFTAWMYWNGICVPEDRTFANLIYKDLTFYQGHDLYEELMVPVRRFQGDYLNARVGLPSVREQIEAQAGQETMAKLRRFQKYKHSPPKPFQALAYNEKVWPLTVSDAYTIEEIQQYLNRRLQKVMTDGLQPYVKTLAELFVTPPEQLMTALDATAPAYLQGAQLPWLKASIPHLGARNLYLFIGTQAQDAKIRKVEVSQFREYAGLTSVKDRPKDGTDTWDTDLQGLRVLILSQLLRIPEQDEDLISHVIFANEAYCRLAETRRLGNFREEEQEILDRSLYRVATYISGLYPHPDDGLPSDSSLAKALSFTNGLFWFWEKWALEEEAKAKEFGISLEHLGQTFDLKYLCLA